ncbi:hypothetical protein BU23DRAFT_574538 [Bimuria novae-zelandiae CBS 107.79]|uniref:Uncharacterized protein n=1 Tax=Bimuria novae-zelandiae CBS 107.79 TaxID=1447943 RepID=A0A6A5UPM5_9PLEO|nr:hypothetical protein BU23DRAFT_574538 [Bimuria novae-zelandiae CBS 107.79]
MTRHRVVARFQGQKSARPRPLTLSRADLRRERPSFRSLALAAAAAAVPALGPVLCCCCCAVTLGAQFHGHDHGQRPASFIVSSGPIRHPGAAARSKGLPGSEWSLPTRTKCGVRRGRHSRLRATESRQGPGRSFQQRDAYASPSDRESAPLESMREGVALVRFRTSLSVIAGHRPTSRFISCLPAASSASITHRSLPCPNRTTPPALRRRRFAPLQPASLPHSTLHTFLRNTTAFLIRFPRNRSCLAQLDDITRPIPTLRLSPTPHLHTHASAI